MLVVAPVSSMNTSFLTSHPGTASLQMSRACCTSSRPCSLPCRVFFKGELPSIQLVPQGADLDRNALFGQPFLHLDQGKIRRGLDPSAQHRLQVGQSRPTVAADLKAASLSRLLQSIAHLVDPHAAHLEASRNLRRTVATIQCPQHTLPKILRISLHPCLRSPQRHYRT